MFKEGVLMPMEIMLTCSARLGRFLQKQKASVILKTFYAKTNSAINQRRND